MIKISKEEVLKIAEISHISLREDEIEPMMKHLQDVLSYAECVQEIAADIEEPLIKSVNVFREDVAVQINPEKILSQAPEREENYFVVPAIIENK
ncbi:Asp-tRNA(Asn)/Glu-tRNA(Gln) amidotransferase subunit GatC [bacterium]|nr:Asp-tRNA(Asn)/Glu-tRNA(Gln) amidotransferase subunit GatC [bacterium]